MCVICGNDKCNGSGVPDNLLELVKDIIDGKKIDSEALLAVNRDALRLAQVKEALNLAQAVGPKVAFNIALGAALKIAEGCPGQMRDIIVNAFEDALFDIRKFYRENTVEQVRERAEKAVKELNEVTPEDLARMFSTRDLN